MNTVQIVQCTYRIFVALCFLPCTCSQRLLHVVNNYADTVQCPCSQQSQLSQRLFRLMSA